MPLRADFPSFNGGEIAPELAARLEVAKYHTALKTARNVLLRTAGGAFSRPGFEFIGQAAVIADATRVMPFQFSSEQSYVLELGDNNMRVIKDGGYVLEAGKVVQGFGGANPLVLEVDANGYAAGDDIYLSSNVGLEDADGISLLNGKVFKVGNPTTNSIELHDELGNPIDATGATPLVSGGSVFRLYRPACPFAPTEVMDVRFVQSADVLYLAHNNHAPLKLSRTGDAAWTFNTISFGPSISPPTGVSASAHVVTAGLPQTFRYLVTAVDQATGQESYHSDSAACNNDLSQAGNFNTISWTAVTGASRYNVYEEVNGIYGYIGGTTDTSFEDKNITPDLGDTPPFANNPFLGSGNYPAAVGFHEQRLTWGGSINKPNGVWMSQSANYENMNASLPAKADDSITFGLVAQQVNEVRAFISTIYGMVAFTSDALFQATGGGVTDYMTPSSIVVRPALVRGCGKAQPVAVDNSIIYSQSKGAYLRSITYQVFYNTYQGNNLSAFASHLVEGHTILQFAWAEYPLSTLFALRDDGVLLALLWMPEQEVWGWTVIETAGTIESICTVTESGEDRLYAVINRTIGGVARRYIERMASPLWLASVQPDATQAFYVDAGRTYSGSPATVIAGLDHLEGETVSILADGAVQPQQVVTNGKIRLAAPASVVTVGLPYQQTLHTLNPVLTAAGSVIGKMQKIGQVVLRVQNTRGLLVGPDENGDEMYPCIGRSDEAYGSPPQLYTGDVPVTLAPEWDRSAGVAIVQSDPLPMQILGVFADVEVGGS